MKAKKIKLNKSRLKKMVKESVQGGKSVMESLQSVANDLGVTKAQVHYAYYKSPVRRTITKLKAKIDGKVTEKEEVKEANGSMIISMDIVSNFFIRDNQLIVTFK